MSDSSSTEPGGPWTDREHEREPGGVTGRGKLEERLQKLAAAGVAGPGGRALRSVSQAVLLRRILDEIGETVLPRRLRLSAGEDRAVVLTAANGRLLRIEGVEGGGALGDAAGEVSGRPFEPADVSLAEPLRALFLALARGVDTVMIRHEAFDNALDPERAGLSAEALADAWGIAGTADGATPAADAIDDFLARSQDLVSAWLLTSVAAPDSEGAGDQDRVEELSAFAEARRETGEVARMAGLAGGAPWSVLMLHRARRAPDATVAVAAGDILLYVTIPHDRLGDLADRWRLAVGA